MAWLRGGLAALVLLGSAGMAMAQERMTLLKIVTSKDEIVVGLTPAEVQALGSGPVLDLVAKQLAAQGQMTVWQYAVRKDAAGNLQQAPLRRVAVFRTDTLRIEPYATPLPVVAAEK